jgi:hypothetical protein
MSELEFASPAIVLATERAVHQESVLDVACKEQKHDLRCPIVLHRLRPQAELQCLLVELVDFVEG